MPVLGRARKGKGIPAIVLVGLVLVAGLMSASSCGGGSSNGGGGGAALPPECIPSLLQGD